MTMIMTDSEELAGEEGFEPGLLGVESDGKTTILKILSLNGLALMSYPSKKIL